MQQSDRLAHKYTVCEQLTQAGIQINGINSQETDTSTGLVENILVQSADQWAYKAEQ